MSPEIGEHASAFHRRRFDAIKDSVSVARLATDLVDEQGAVLRQSGTRLRGLCPLCGNGLHSQALSVDLEKDLWHCFSCDEGGDVITLANLHCQYSSPAMACSWLAYRYGVELPERPEAWFKKQDRQQRLRARLEKERKEVKRRRLFKTIVVPQIREMTPPDELEAEIRASWERLKETPVD